MYWKRIHTDLKRIGTDLKRIRTDLKMKHEVLDCSFEMLEPGGGGGTGAWWCYPLPIAINTATFYTLH